MFMIDRLENDFLQTGHLAESVPEETADDDRWLRTGISGFRLGVEAETCGAGKAGS